MPFKRVKNYINGEWRERSIRYLKKSRPLFSRSMLFQKFLDQLLGDNESLDRVRSFIRFGEFVHGTRP